MQARWAFKIEYAGSHYSGWQRQKRDPSIQQAVEEALAGFCQNTPGLTVAGRTDSGVHAFGQVAHADILLKKSMTALELVKAINAHLRGHAIAVLAARQVPDAFDARRDACNKLYCYRILCRKAPPVIEKDRVWHIPHDLDVEAMSAAARHLLGHHDFTTFRDSQCQARSPLRTLDRLDIGSQAYSGEIGREGAGTEIRIEAEAQSFLHHQVRNFAGTLKLVGEGKWTPENVKSALQARDRRAGGPTAPPQGLYLMRVDYLQPLFDDARAVRP